MDILQEQPAIPSIPASIETSESFNTTYLDQHPINQLNNSSDSSAFFSKVRSLAN